MTTATLTRADLLALHALHAYNAGVEAARAAYDEDPLAAIRSESRVCHWCRRGHCRFCGTAAVGNLGNHLVACRCWLNNHDRRTV